MNYSFEYLSTRSGKAIILIFQNKKYLFNCFEGFQRYSVESQVKLRQIDVAFLPTKKSVIPFIGTYLTIGDTNKNHIEIITKEESLFPFIKKFAKRPDLRISFHYPEYEDKILKIQTLPSNECLNVILSIKPGRGKFLKEKAAQENIHPKYWSKLCDKKIINVDGKEFNGNDFLEKDIEPEKIAIIFNLNNFENIEILFFDKDIKYFICFDEKAVIYLKKYFKTEIFYVLKDSEDIEYHSLCEIQCELYKIDSSYNFSKKNKRRKYELKKDKSIIYLNSCDSLVYDKTNNLYEVKYANKNKKIKLPEEIQSVHDGVLFLGTGSAIPSKYRNVTSIIAEYKDTCIFLDCGEDTLFNIHRVYKNFDILKRVDLIFISHSHADHHLGLVSVIEKILEFKEKIKIILPDIVRNFCEQFFSEGVEYFSTDVFDRKIKIRDLYPKTIEENTKVFDFGYKVTICPVIHCSDSCGISIHFEDKSISFSGDCRPSKMFSFISKNVDLMIHEATFDDDLKLNAMRTKHSTFEDAFEVFKSSGAKTLILTHFSQRYPKFKNYPDTICAFDFFKYDFTSKSLEKSKKIAVLFEKKRE